MSHIIKNSSRSLKATALILPGLVASACNLSHTSYTGTASGWSGSASYDSPYLETAADYNKPGSPITISGINKYTDCSNQATHEPDYLEVQNTTVFHIGKKWLDSGDKDYAQSSASGGFGSAYGKGASN